MYSEVINSLRFGKFDLSLSVPETLAHLIPASYNAFLVQEKNQPHCSVNICVNKCSTWVQQHNGWQYVHSNGEKQLVYSRNDLAFSLRYIPRHANVSVDVCKNSRISLALGIQYAALVGLSKDCVGFHGVTLICGSQVVVLSAPSGTGKTTLSKLLQRYCRSAVINGDFALLSLNENGEVIFEPTPFCGSSRICQNYRLRVDRIIFLSQATENQITVLDTRKALQQMMSNSFMPEQDQELQKNIHLTILKIIEKVPISEFAFAPSKEAAQMLHDYVTL